VRQNIISFANGAELLLVTLLIRWIFHWVVLGRESLESVLDLLGSGVSGDLELLVVIDVHL